MWTASRSCFDILQRVIADVGRGWGSGRVTGLRFNRGRIEQVDVHTLTPRTSRSEQGELSCSLPCQATDAWQAGGERSSDCHLIAPGAPMRVMSVPPPRCLCRKTTPGQAGRVILLQLGSDARHVGSAGRVILRQLGSDASYVGSSRASYPAPCLAKQLMLGTCRPSGRRHDAVRRR